VIEVGGVMDVELLSFFDSFGGWQQVNVETLSSFYDFFLPFVSLYF